MIRTEKKMILTNVYCGTCQINTRGFKTIPTWEIKGDCAYKTEQCVCSGCGVAWQHTDVYDLKYHYTISNQIIDEQEDNKEPV